MAMLQGCSTVTSHTGQDAAPAAPTIVVQGTDYVDDFKGCQPCKTSLGQTVLPGKSQSTFQPLSVFSTGASGSPLASSAQAVVLAVLASSVSR